MASRSILWRRLDSPGHDACRLTTLAYSSFLEGTAVFRNEGAPACLSYTLTCDAGWRTRAGIVRGWIGERPINLQIARTAEGFWTLNGQLVPRAATWIDLDFGFTPSTNLVQLNRAALPIGFSADISVAWLDAASGALETLHQRYERRTADTYWYEAPRFHYEALLHVDTTGFVEAYPRLWEAERR